MGEDIKVENFNDKELNNNSKKGNKKPKKKKGLRNTLIALAVIIAMYCLCVFSNIPFIAKWRTIYIETAMTTHSHQWMAKCFIPYWIIDEVMDKYYAEQERQQALESKWKEETETEEDTSADEVEAFYKKYWELDTLEFRNYIERNSYLISQGYDKILIQDLENTLGLTTVEGDPLLVLDTENNLMIIGVSDTNYVGKMAIVKDPAQIELGKAERFGAMGELVDSFAERYDAVLATNAGGFADTGGHGTGAQVKGSMVIDGVEMGVPRGPFWKFFGMKYDNRLYVTNYDYTIVPQFRWAIEFYPALIVDGECVVDGTYGMGIQPRATVGQAENGDFMILIVDGRQVGYSLGCTVQECSDIMMRYKAIQGANLDGGSSAVMWYNGEQITKSSSKAGNGRYMPNALIVNKASKVSGTSSSYSTSGTSSDTSTGTSTGTTTGTGY